MPSSRGGPVELPWGVGASTLPETKASGTLPAVFRSPLEVWSPG